MDILVQISAKLREKVIFSYHCSLGFYVGGDSGGGVGESGCDLLRL